MLEKISVKTKTLNVEVRTGGPDDGPVILLLHGWPDDATTWAQIAPKLHEAGFKTIAPMHRAFGGTTFRSKSTKRTGNMGVLCLDAIELMDALEIEKFFVAGHDWGSNVTEALAVNYPRRIPRIAMLSTPSRLGGLKTPAFHIARLHWYHWFQATKKGMEAVTQDRNGFARIMWHTWSPPGWFEEATFNKVAESFAGPDWVRVTLHSYQARWGEAPYDPRSLKVEAKVKQTQQLKTPTLFIHGEEDGVNPPELSEKMSETNKLFLIKLHSASPFSTGKSPAKRHKASPDLLVQARLLQIYR